MRIIAGKFKGTRLVQPNSETIRPTSDRVRESLFNILEHGKNACSLAQFRVLDLFAGTGALGLEAMSRGAAFCLFVDNQANARAIIRQNIENLSLTGATKVFRRDATKLGDSGRYGRFDLVFLDPPYAKNLGNFTLTSLFQGNWLNPSSLIVLEESHNSALELPNGLELLDSRVYRDTCIYIIQPLSPQG